MSAVWRALGATLGLVTMSTLAVPTARAGFTTFETGEVRPLAMSPDGTKLFVANTPDGRLEIFSIDAGGLTHSGSVAVGLEPCAVAARTNSEVWVVNHLSDSISIVNVASSPPRVTRTLLVGDEPRDIVFAGAAGNRAFITTAHRGQQRTDMSIAAGRAGLIIKNRGGNSNGLTWKWLKGAVSIPQLGDPTADTRYALCLYDESGQVPSLALSLDVPAGGSCGVLPCWSALGGSNLRGYRFLDFSGQHDGAKKMLLKGGRPGRDKLRIRASGGALPLPPAVSASAYFAQQDEVTVQLVSDAGGCWESVFPIGAVLHNSPRLYKATR
jgi:YVTN family beta-propeller protein